MTHHRHYHRHQIGDNSTIVTLILLLVAFPIGLVVMWGFTGWPKFIKALVTLIPGMFFGLLLIMAFLLGVLIDF